MFDIHCHILPGVDDGSETMKETALMVMEAQKSGIDHIVCTPHCRAPWWDYDAIQKSYQAFLELTAERRIKVDLGYEVNWKMLMEIGLDWAPRLTLGETNLFLLEFSDEALPVQWQKLIFKLQGMGLEVIIAHPERYRPVQKNIDIAYEMVNMGCHLQLSANFISGPRSDARRKTATALLREDLVDYVASDAHCHQDYAVYRQALKFAQSF